MKYYVGGGSICYKTGYREVSYEDVWGKELYRLRFIEKSKDYELMDGLRRAIIEVWQGFMDVSYTADSIEVFNKGVTIGSVTIPPKTFLRSYK